MPEKQASALEKARIGALIAVGAIVLWFLVVNLFTYCEISLWPIAKFEKLPGTLFIVSWLALGFAGGFGFCYVWLRRKNLGKAFDILSDKENGKKDDDAQKADAQSGEETGAA